MKNCNKCNIIKPFDAFELRSDTGKYRNACKMCLGNKYKIDICYQTKTKVCIQCDVKKSFDCFSEKKYKNGTIALMVKCKECLDKNKKERQRESYTNWIQKSENKLKANNNQRKYHEINKNRINQKMRERWWNNRDVELVRSRRYSIENKEKIKEKRRDRAKILRLTSPCFKLKENLSREIRRALLKNNKSKNNHSILNYLPYSIQDLKQHLESQFESWMTWKNYGKYDKNKWNDHDNNTWKWEIDHIIPRSDLKYTTMEEENFKKCWALENLRPLSAKQNFLDGVNKSRHKKVSSHVL